MTLPTVTPTVPDITRDQRLPGCSVARLAEAALRRAIRRFNATRGFDPGKARAVREAERRLVREVGQQAADALYEQILHEEGGEWEKTC